MTYQIITCSTVYVPCVFLQGSIFSFYFLVYKGNNNKKKRCFDLCFGAPFWCWLIIFIAFDEEIGVSIRRSTLTCVTGHILILLHINVTMLQQHENAKTLRVSENSNMAFPMMLADNSGNCCWASWCYNHPINSVCWSIVTWGLSFSNNSHCHFPPNTPPHNLYYCHLPPWCPSENSLTQCCWKRNHILQKQGQGAPYLWFFIWVFKDRAFTCEVDNRACISQWTTEL